MDNYRAWFKAETNTFKEIYCQTVDNYFDLFLSQVDAITSRTGDESPRELSQMIKHMEDTNTLYQSQLDWLSRRYFAGKATFSTVPSTIKLIINDSSSVTNLITISHPNTVDFYQVNTFAECSTNQPQQANICKRSDANEVSHQASSDSLKRSLPSFGSENNSIAAKRARGVQVKTHTCSKCGQSFGRKTCLKRHQLTHNQERPFPCDQCERTFARKDHLSVHLLTHSGTMNARCTWSGCTFQAITTSNVVRHIRGMHFQLPQSKTKQMRLGIVDDRDAHEYIEKM